MSGLSKRNEDFYQRFRVRIQEWLAGKGKNYKYADYLLVGPDLFHLMCKLVADERVSASDKAKFVAAIAYFISPADLIPEGLVGPIGYIDDIALAAYVLNRFINAGHEDIALEHWAGDGDLLQIIKQIIAVADKLIGSGLWRKLKQFINR